MNGGGVKFGINGDWNKGDVKLMKLKIRIEEVFKQWIIFVLINTMYICIFLRYVGRSTDLNIFAFIKFPRRNVFWFYFIFLDYIIYMGYVSNDFVGFLF